MNERAKADDGGRKGDVNDAGNVMSRGPGTGEQIRHKRPSPTLARTLARVNTGKQYIYLKCGRRVCKIQRSR